MTLAEKVSLLGGKDYFYTTPVDRLGIPSLFFADATHGVHLRDEFRDMRFERPLERSTSFPCGLMLASTWNRDLAQAYGEAVGEECRAGGIAVLLGPGVNIYRQAQCGRNFEYFGEDPLLAGEMAASYVRGMQSTGTMATVKHFVANNTDYFRRRSNSIVVERALHEIYMPAFEACIEAGVMAVMTSYNLLDGEWCGQSEAVINGLLRDELGFEGLVMTDWWSVWDGEMVIRSGQDLEMPAREATAEAEALVSSGRVSESDVERMAVSFLSACKAMELFERRPDAALLEKFPVHEQVAYETALEGCVLLKNREALLPLPGEGSILLTGEALDEIIQGGGAAVVEGYHHVTLAAALEDALGGRLVIKPEATERDLAAADIVICNVVTRDSEGWDRPFALDEKQEDRVRALVRSHPRTVLLLNTGSGIRMVDWIEEAGAVLFTYYSGQNGARAITDLLTGRASPSGKLPMTLEREFAESPGAGYLPAGESLYSGWNDAEEKRRQVYDIPYNEGVFVGYRWYDHRQVSPLFPFGFGLSYTRFEYEGLALVDRWKEQASVDVIFTVRNVGDRKGSEIAQVYVTDPQSAVERPLKELKGFAKIVLEPGEAAEVRVSLSRRAFSYWDPETRAWKCEDGQFFIRVGGSSDALPLEGSVALEDN